MQYNNHMLHHIILLSTCNFIYNSVLSFSLNHLSGIYKDMAAELQAAIDQHKLHRILYNGKQFDDYAEEYRGEDISLTRQEQIVNALSNDAAPHGRASVAHSMYFSTGTAIQVEENGITSKYIPTSVRNRVLYLWRLNKRSELLDVMCPQEAHEKKRKQHLPKESARTKKNRTHVEEHEATPAHDLQPPHSTTPFMTFEHQLVGLPGVLKWRIHGSEVDVLSLNDIDLDSGKFLKNQFIHMWRWRSAINSEVTYFCTCRMYITVLRMEDHERSNHGNNCCHVRFFTERIEPVYSSLFSPDGAATILPQTPLGQKIQKSLDGINVPVVRLDSDTLYHRYSVLSNDLKSCSVVTLQGKRFCCKDGKCRASKGHTRKAPQLDDPSNCEHIKALNANPEQWRGLCQMDSQSSDEDDTVPTEETVDQSTNEEASTPQMNAHVSLIVCQVNE